MICAALLVAGLCGCEKQLIPEINLADNLEGSWEKVYPEGVQDAGLVIWDFKAGDADPQTWILSIYVSDLSWIMTSSKRTGRPRIRLLLVTGLRSAARTSWCLSALK